MQRYSIKNQNALVTGASSGIGKACAEQLAALGVNLVITARRFDRLKEIANRLIEIHGVRVLPIELDIQRYDQVVKLVNQVNDEKFDIDILVNNAGLALSTDKIQEARVENWDIMINTNVKGLLYMTRAVLPQMIERNSGHIINIGSVAGHDCYPSGNVYCATKHAVRAISKSLRIDLFGTAIRVSEIDPGAVETEFSEIRWNDKARAKAFYQEFQPLIAEDIADTVIYCATRPTHVNVSEIVVYPQAQSSVAQICRNNDPKKIISQAK
jgi:NADP-dependent 3-hydroxy acid dehydrogenase YdfG